MYNDILSTVVVYLCVIEANHFLNDLHSNKTTFTQMPYVLYHIIDRLGILTRNMRRENSIRYRIIDFNEVDMRIYLPKIIHRGR